MSTGPYVPASMLLREIKSREARIVALERRIAELEKALSRPRGWKARIEYTGGKRESI